MVGVLMHNERALIQRMGAYCHNTYSLDAVDYEIKAKAFLERLKTLFKSDTFRNHPNQLNIPNFGSFLVKERTITMNHDDTTEQIKRMVFSFKSTSEWRRRVAHGEPHLVDVVNRRLVELYPEWDKLTLGFVVESFINVLTMGLINNEGYKIINLGNFFPRERKVSCTS